MQLIIYIVIFLVISFATATLQKKSNVIKRIVRYSLINLVLSYFIVIILFKFIDTVGVSDDFMSPTLHKGDTVLFLTSPLFVHPKRGDIIFYTNKNKPNVGLYARIIGVEGDKVLITNGFVYLNGQLLEEPYTSKPHDTFVYPNAIMGQNCQQIDVPRNKFFVLTDFREGGSLGSLSKAGFVDYKDINGIPVGISSFSRDTSHDKDLVGKSVFDANKYVELLNQKRTENGVSPLRYDKKVELSAELRLEDMIKNNNFTANAIESGKSFINAGFPPSALNSDREGVDQAYYDSASLLDSYWNSQNKTVLLDKNLQSIGIVSKVVDINNCPNQIIIQHFLGQQ